MNKTIYTFAGIWGTYFVTDPAGVFESMDGPRADTAFAFTDGRGSTGYAYPQESMGAESLDDALRLLVGDE